VRRRQALETRSRPVQAQELRSTGGRGAQDSRPPQDGPGLYAGTISHPLAQNLPPWMAL